MPKRVETTTTKTTTRNDRTKTERQIQKQNRQFTQTCPHSTSYGGSVGRQSHLQNNLHSAQNYQNIKSNQVHKNDRNTESPKNNKNVDDREKLSHRFCEQTCQNAIIHSIFRHLVVAFSKRKSVSRKKNHNNSNRSNKSNRRKWNFNRIFKPETITTRTPCASIPTYFPSFSHHLYNILDNISFTTPGGCSADFRWFFKRKMQPQQKEEDSNNNRNTIAKQEVNQPRIELEALFKKEYYQQQQQMVKSDTCAVLCDINCHRWIATIISYSFIYPSIQLPSNRHFQFASVHDVSNLSNFYNKAQMTGYWHRCCCCCWCLYSSSNPSGRKLQDEHLNQTIIQNNQCQTFHRSTNPVPLSTISIINSDAPIKSSTCTPVMVIPDNSDFNPMDSTEHDNYYDEDICPTMEITPDYSDTYSVTYQQQSQSQLKQRDYNGVHLPQQDGLGGSQSKSFSSESIKSAGCVPKWKCYLVNFVFILVTLRYVIHLALIIFYQNRTNRTSISYRYCPLIMAMFESLSSMTTVMMIYCRRGPLEELIISTSSFFRPLCSWQRVFIIQMLTIFYLFASLIFMFINCFPWFPGITAVDSSWHRYRRSEYSAVLSNLLISTVSKTQQQKTTIQSARTQLQLMSPTNERSLNIRVASLVNEFDPEFWNFTSALPWEDWDDFLSVTNGTTLSMATLTTTYPDNMTDAKQTSSSRLPRFSPTPSVPFLSTPTIRSPYNLWNLLFYFDFFAHLITQYSLVLMKTFHLSICLLVILKCWQLYEEIRKQKFKKQAQNTLKRQEQKMEVGIGNPRQMRSDLWQRRQRRYQQFEIERLQTLTRVLCQNIQLYENVFGHLLLIWLSLSFANVLAIVEFYSCLQQEKITKYNSSHNTVLLFEPFLRWASMIIHGQDFLLLLAGYLAICLIRQRCLVFTRK